MRLILENWKKFAIKEELELQRDEETIGDL